MTNLTFALYSFKKNIQSSAELRSSFLMNVVGMMINNTAFILLWVFFTNSVGVIGGWQAVDIIGLQGFTATAYGAAFSLAYGIRKIPEYINSGAFDRFMLSPKSLLMRVATSAFSPSAVGDLLYGIICLVIYAMLISASWAQIGLIIVLIISSSIIFLSSVLVAYSMAFFFVDGQAISTGLFELILTPALFHGGAFQGGIRFFFIFLIPALVIGALPVEAVRAISLPGLGLIAGISIFWLLLSRKIFYLAIRKYESSNFFSFGN